MLCYGMSHVLISRRILMHRCTLQASMLSNSLNFKKMVMQYDCQNKNIKITAEDMNAKSPVEMRQYNPKLKNYNNEIQIKS